MAETPQPHPVHHDHPFDDELESSPPTETVTESPEPSTYESLFGKIGRRHAQLLSWMTQSLVLPLAKSLTVDTVVNIDIAGSICSGKRVPRLLVDDSNAWFFPSNLCENDHESRSRICSIVNQACACAGFRCNGKLRVERRTSRIKSKVESVRFLCTYHRFHDEEGNKRRNKRKARVVKRPDLAPVPRSSNVHLPVRLSPDNDDDTQTDTTLSTDDENVSCKCGFYVYFHEDLKLWFVPHQQSGCLQHSGHLKLDPDHVQLRLLLKHVLPESEQELTRDNFESGSNTTSTLSLLHQRQDLNLLWHQVHYLQIKLRKNLVICDFGANASGTNLELSTPADRLIALLLKDKSKSFIALYGDVSSNAITIRTRHWKNNGKPTDSRMDSPIILGDSSDSPIDHVQRLRSNLTDSSNGKILLCIVWTTDVARRKFDMFPESAGEDDADKTNIEQRPHFMMSSKDGDNFSFAFLWGFLAARAVWQYTWIHLYAAPVLFPGTALHRLEQLTSDACQRITKSLDNVIAIRNHPADN